MPYQSHFIARIVMRLIDSVQAGQGRVMEPPAHSQYLKHAQFSRPSQEAPVSMVSFFARKPVKDGQGPDLA